MLSERESGIYPLLAIKCSKLAGKEGESAAKSSHSKISSLPNARAFGVRQLVADTKCFLGRARRLGANGYSTVTDFARLRGWSTSQPRRTAM